MSTVPPTVTIRAKSPLPSLVVWPLVVLAYGAAMTAAALWGMKSGERGLDTRAQELLACYAVGSPLGLLALAPIYRFLMPRRSLLRYVLAPVLVAGASTAAIVFLAYLVTTPIAEAFRPGIPLIIRVRSLVEPYLAEIFLFLTLGQRIAMPQALVPMLLAAWWLGRRRGRP